MIKHATKIIIAILSLTVIATAADAKPRHKGRKMNGIVICNQLGCSDRPGPAAHMRVQAEATLDANGNDTIIGGRPAGCPHAFCGCEASLYVFGEIRPTLNVARNWRVKFPRAVPAPGMAAVRTHHVMILMSHADGHRWLVHDGNSGGGKTREHIMSIRGYTVVDPHGSHEAEGLTAQASYNGH